MTHTHTAGKQWDGSPVLCPGTQSSERTLFFRQNNTWFQEKNRSQTSSNLGSRKQDLLSRCFCGCSIPCCCIPEAALMPPRGQEMPCAPVSVRRSHSQGIFWCSVSQMLTGLEGRSSHNWLECWVPQRGTHPSPSPPVPVRPLLVSSPLPKLFGSSSEPRGESHLPGVGNAAVQWGKRQVHPPDQETPT